MNFFKKLFGYSFQSIMYGAAFFLNFSEPKIYSGEGKYLEIPSILKENNKKHTLIVTDDVLYGLGIINPLMEVLKKEEIEYEIFHNVVANPTVDNVENGLKTYLENHCDSFIAVGGGSALDCCKGIGARLVNPKKSLNQMKGVLKVRKRLPFTIAVPTTAGTGSEATVAAVIVDKENDDKYAIDDPKIIPQIAVLDPTLLTSLPKQVISTTGMDVLTHAVEAFIGHANTKKTYQYGLDATKKVFQFLEKSVNEPKNLEYRSNMQLASYKAGVAFTRAYVGSVHSVAHALGGKYNVPHGLANAIILPIILKEYGKSAERKLSILADAVNISGKDNHEKAQNFIRAIEEMNERMGVTNSFGNLIKDEDISFLAKHAYKEAFPLYPTPTFFEIKDYERIIKSLKK